jgi:hypothetical protein
MKQKTENYGKISSSASDLWLLETEDTEFYKTFIKKRRRNLH